MTHHPHSSQSQCGIYKMSILYLLRFAMQSSQSSQTTYLDDDDEDDFASF